MLVAVLVVLAGPVAAQDSPGDTVPDGDESIGDIRRDREQVRDAEAAALETLELLELEDERLGEVVAEIQAAVDAQASQVQAARQRLDAAEEEVRRRERAAADAAAEIVRTEQAIRDRAVDTFVGTQGRIEPWLTSSDLNRTAIRLAMIGFTAGSDRDQLDDLRTIQAEREENVRAGEDARTEADSLRVALEDELAELEARNEVQARIQAELQSRIAEWENEVDRRAREAEELTDLIRQKQAEELGFDPGDPGAASIEGFVFPTDGEVRSGFGPRVHPIFGSLRLHSGFDISGSSGQPVRASKEGRVIFAGVKGGYGITVIVQHEGNVATLYAHMSALRTSEGEQVDTGEIVGLVGSTGWSTGPHLHFETRVDGVPKDPALFLPA
jgi:murein DD-endopeptidase MepM/ murein hydrolase activator NlpD